MNKREKKYIIECYLVSALPPRVVPSSIYSLEKQEALNIAHPERIEGTPTGEGTTDRHKIVKRIYRTAEGRTQRKHTTYEHNHKN